MIHGRFKCSNSNNPALVLLFLVLVLLGVVQQRSSITTVSAFTVVQRKQQPPQQQPPPQQQQQQQPQSQRVVIPTRNNILQVARAADATGEEQIGFWDDDEEEEDEDDDEDDYEEERQQQQLGNSNQENNKKVNKSRWEKLSPKMKEKVRQQAQERAIANKKKNEPIAEKKRRLMMFVKEQQRKKKRDAKVQRPVPFQNRTLLSELEINKNEVPGTVISLTHFGAYVDIGTECDGLLHVSQLSSTVFVEHPRQLLSPGDEITVRIRSTNPERKKLHLTMLPLEVLEQEQAENDFLEEKIPLTELQPDDELWGALKRVTDFGAYVEVGAQVDGWLHFMDHPTWEVGQHPSEFMAVGDRVRVWVSDVDLQQSRLKLTANRPPHLPGPKREFFDR